jgi:hypothetical protein
MGVTHHFAEMRGDFKELLLPYLVSPDLKTNHRLHRFHGLRI